MINFKQKEFTEYDAMRSLYVELMRPENRLRVEVISQSELIPILKGNNVVIEKFVISSSIFNKDRYRLYLKIGAKAKMPDKIRFGGRHESKKLGSMKLEFNSSIKEKTYSLPSTLFQKNFSKSKNNGPAPLVKANLPVYADISYNVDRLLADAVSYDLKSRSLVLEVDSIRDAINVLNVLPFGINYKLYLLN
jgi:hypothetical protein